MAVGPKSVIILAILMKNVVSHGEGWAQGQDKNLINFITRCNALTKHEQSFLFSFLALNPKIQSKYSISFKISANKCMRAEMQNLPEID